MSKSSAAARAGRTSRNSRNAGFGASRRRGGHLSVVESFTRPQRTMPFLIALTIWRWRWELAVLIAGVIGYVHLAGLELSRAEWILLAEIPIAVVAIPFTRRFVRNRLLCVYTRHRLRSCLAQVRAMNPSGQLPLVVSAVSTRVGEKLWLIMRPGLSVNDIAAQTEEIASACWAGESRVTRSKRFACLVRVDVIRRDSLGRELVPNPLTQLRNGGFIATGRDYTNLHTGAEFSPRRPGSADPEGLLADLAFPQPGRPADPPAPRKRPSGTRPSTPPGTPPVTGHNGEDLSDYV